MCEKIISKHVGSVDLFSLLLIWNERLLRGRNEENIPPEIRPISSLHLSEVQPKRRRKAESNIFVWKEDLVYYLTNQWQQEEILYNVNHVQYYDKGKGMKAVEKIRENMSAREFNPLPSPEQIIEKMNGLRTYFNTQRNKLASSKSSGAGTNSVYKNWWQFYEPLSFLLDMVTPRKTISNLEETHSLLPPSCPNSTKKIRS